MFRCACVLLVLFGLFQKIYAQTFGDFDYSVSNDEITITGYRGGASSLAIPELIDGKPVVAIGGFAFNQKAFLTNVVLPPSLRLISVGGFYECYNIRSVVIPSNAVVENYAFDKITTLIDDGLIQTTSSILAGNTNFITALANNSAFVAAVATNDVFVAAVANKILAASNNYGLVTQSGISNTITTLATKTELTNALAESRADGINSVISNPNLWTLYTTNQIHAMAIGDLVLTSTNNGQFVLNYDIEQSEDLVNWTPYQGFAMPLTNLPTNKAFVRIKAKQ